MAEERASQVPVKPLHENPQPPPEPGWARQLRWVSPVGTFLTILVLLGSAVVAGLVYSEARRQNAAQRQGAVEQQKLLRGSIDQNTISNIYTLGMEMNKFLVQYPDIRVYFEASEDYRVPPQPEDPAKRQVRLNQRFDKESETTKQRVWTYCQMLSDFFEYTYVLRHLLPPRDWEGWWSYFCDAYDESHFLRAYLTNRPNWYTIDEVLPLPKDKRAAWYAEDKARIAHLKAERN